MEKLTYKQAYDKIIEAYFKDEIKPYDPKFCFCGTLNKGCDDYWKTYDIKLDGIYYYGAELQKLEEALFSKLPRYCPDRGEEKLFAGMCAALDVLKEIHRERGENVDELPTLTKRQLAV